MSDAFSEELAPLSAEDLRAFKEIADSWWDEYGPINPPGADCSCDLPDTSEFAVRAYRWAIELTNSRSRRERAR